MLIMEEIKISDPVDTTSNESFSITMKKWLANPPLKLPECVTEK